jgi:hypothetical protein
MYLDHRNPSPIIEAVNIGKKIEHYQQILMRPDRVELKPILAWRVICTIYESCSSKHLSMFFYPLE